MLHVVLEKYGRRGYLKMPFLLTHAIVDGSRRWAQEHGRTELYEKQFVDRIKKMVDCVIYKKQPYKDELRTIRGILKRWAQLEMFGTTTVETLILAVSQAEQRAAEDPVKVRQRAIERQAAATAAAQHAARDVHAALAVPSVMKPTFDQPPPPELGLAGQGESSYAGKGGGEEGMDGASDGGEPGDGPGHDSSSAVVVHKPPAERRAETRLACRQWYFILRYTPLEIKRAVCPAIFDQQGVDPNALDTLAQDEEVARILADAESLNNDLYDLSPLRVRDYPRIVKSHDQLEQDAEPAVHDNVAAAYMSNLLVEQRCVPVLSTSLMLHFGQQSPASMGFDELDVRLAEKGASLVTDIVMQNFFASIVGRLGGVQMLRIKWPYVLVSFVSREGAFEASTTLARSIFLAQCYCKHLVDTYFESDGARRLARDVEGDEQDEGGRAGASRAKHQGRHGGEEESDDEYEYVTVSGSEDEEVSSSEEETDVDDMRSSFIDDSDESDLMGSGDESDDGLGAHLDPEEVEEIKLQLERLRDPSRYAGMDDREMRRARRTDLKSIEQLVRKLEGREDEEDDGDEDDKAVLAARRRRERAMAAKARQKAKARKAEKREKDRTRRQKLKELEEKRKAKKRQRQMDKKRAGKGGKKGKRRVKRRVRRRKAAGSDDEEAGDDIGFGGARDGGLEEDGEVHEEEIDLDGPVVARKPPSSVHFSGLPWIAFATLGFRWMCPVFAHDHVVAVSFGLGAFWVPFHRIDEDDGLNSRIKHIPVLDPALQRLVANIEDHNIRVSHLNAAIETGTYKGDQMLHPHPEEVFSHDDMVHHQEGGDGVMERGVGEGGMDSEVYPQHGGEGGHGDVGMDLQHHDGPVMVGDREGVPEHDQGVTAHDSHGTVSPTEQADHASLQDGGEEEHVHSAAVEVVAPGEDVGPTPAVQGRAHRGVGVGVGVGRRVGGGVGVGVGGGVGVAHRGASGVSSAPQEPARHVPEREAGRDGWNDTDGMVQFRGRTDEARPHAAESVDNEDDGYIFDGPQQKDEHSSNFSEGNGRTGRDEGEGGDDSRGPQPSHALFVGPGGSDAGYNDQTSEPRFSGRRDDEEAPARPLTDIGRLVQEAEMHQRSGQDGHDGGNRKPGSSRW